MEECKGIEQMAIWYFGVATLMLSDMEVELGILQGFVGVVGNKSQLFDI
jgi:hypothetical protein